MKRSIFAAVASGVALGGIVAGAGRKPLRAKRGGFTLVELLVVITIIAVLATLSLRVMVGILTLTRESATKSTVSRINRLVSSRLEAWSRKYGGSDRATVARLKNTAEYHTAGQFLTDNGFPVNENQRLILTRKLLYAAHTPQTKSDLTGPPWNLPAADVASMDNAEVLYYLTIRAPVINEPVYGANDVKYGHEVTAFSDREIDDPDGDGHPAFIDAWGNPIHLWRWPTAALPAFAENIPARDLARDPMDPLGQMANVADFESRFHRRGAMFVPLVVSGGSDGETGILSPDDGGSEGQIVDIDSTHDNVTGLKIREGN